MNDEALLELHRRLVETPSVSHQEQAAADLMEAVLREGGAHVERIGDNVVARTGGSGPCLLLDTHLDTVPPGEGWTREPFKAAREEGRVYGLGANDAKGCAAAMTAAYLRLAGSGPPLDLVLLLVPEEETGGKGTELAWPLLRDRGLRPAGVVVGEPTGLDLAVAQKGMLVLALEESGEACHSAHARALGARNAVRSLARDLVALEGWDPGPEHPLLGATTLEPTTCRGGSARNRVPEEATCFLDCRTVPGISHEELVARLRGMVAGHLRVVSGRLRPRSCPQDAAIVRAARRAHPAARCYGSSTMSDLVFFEGVPAVKCGPGRSERSHTADEFILEQEVLEGARFYETLARTFSEECDGMPVGQG